MWELIPKLATPEGDASAVHLVVEKEYIVGRKDCPVLIKDDPSISRKHAVISVSYNIADLGDPSKLPEVTIKDSSKYGTAVNGTKIESGISCKVNNGDEIVFGTHNSTHRLSYTPAIFVTSCLETSKKKTLKKQIHKLGGHLISEWRHGCSTHLVMDGLTFTIKVIHALANCCPIVTPEYVDELIKASEGNQSLPESNRFLPPIKEETIKNDGQKFLPDPKRKMLFSGKNFIFLSRKQYKRTYEAVERCGGKTSLMATGVSSSDEDKLVGNGCCVMMVDAKERDSLPPDAKTMISQSMDILKKHKNRPIPESELGLAILQISLDKYCNPSMDAVPMLTHNIVCQSLQLGPEDISQVFSQQHAPETQFKKPVTPIKSHQTKLPTVKLETAAKISVMDTVLETQTQYQESPVRKQVAHTKRETVGETQIESTSPHTPHPQQKSAVILDSISKSPIQTSTTKHALASETPLDEATEERKRPSKDDKKRHFVAESEMDISHSVAHALASDTLNESVGKKRTVSNNNEEFAVPESMDVGNGSFIRGRTQRGSSSSSETGREAPVEWKSAKRMRSSESDVSQVIAEGMKPLKRARNQDPKEEIIDQADGMSRKNHHSEESTSSRNGIHGHESSPDENNEGDVTRNRSTFQGRNDGARRVTKRRHVEDDNTFDTDQSEGSDTHGSGSIPPLQNTRPVTVLPDGFLSARIPRKQVVEQAAECDEEDSQPRHVMVIDEVSLVVRRPRERRQATQTANLPATNVKNFKKFRKQWYPGCDRALPRIIGGSDLAVFETTSRLEQEDWFVEAREIDVEQERLDREAEQLFMMEPRGNKRWKR